MTCRLPATGETMALGDDWEKPHSDRLWGLGDTALGSLHVALLFGAGAVALALVLTPIAESQTERLLYSSYPAGLDMMPTGTVGQRSTGSYTIRRSVLQPSPNSVCIIRDNGMRTGDC